MHPCSLGVQTPSREPETPLIGVQLLFPFISSGKTLNYAATEITSKLWKMFSDTVMIQIQVSHHFLLFCDIESLRQMTWKKVQIAKIENYLFESTN